MSMVRVPANFDIPDKVLFGLSARQVVILGPAAPVVIALWKVLDDVVSPLGLLVACAPVAVIAAGLALGRRDGTSLDRLALAAIRQPRRPVAPGRLNTTMSLRATAKRPREIRVGALRGPIRAICDDGVLDLGSSGFALGLDASTVNFGLRSESEQATLTGGFARVLHAMPTGLHIVVSHAPADVASHVTHASDAASRLHDPRLAAAAHEYTAWLSGLIDDAAMVRRLITVVVTAPCREAAIRAGEIVSDGCAAVGVSCSRLNAVQLAARIRSGVDPFVFPEGE